MDMSKFFKWTGVATSVVTQALGKTMDGDLTLSEGLDVAENAARMAVPELGDSDFARFGAITSPMEFQAHEFREGDVLINIPGELAGKLKVEFDI